MSNPRGMRDFGPEEMATRNSIIKTISDIFETKGAYQIDTPVMERKDVLFGQYGEDQKLVFDLDDQGGVPCALRYDLTVPFARYMASSGKTKMKRFQIGKVYRRDDPSILQGRYREFYQCDFDIAGDYDVMVADAEVIKTLADILSTYNEYFTYTIKLNYKSLLDAILSFIGVPEEKVMTVCSSIDKLDKLDWEKVAKELETKGIGLDCIDRIKDMTQIKGNPYEILAILEKYNEIPNIPVILEELRILFSYLEAFGVIDLITFDTSLARGLSYYTGVIFEAVCLEKNVNVGSIAAGGRYDNLIGKFARKQIKSVGCSIGLERLFTIIDINDGKKKRNDILYVTYFYSKNDKKENKEMFNEVLKLSSFLWKNGIQCKFVEKQDVMMKEQIVSCLSENIRWMIVFGSNEFKNGEIIVKDLENRKQSSVKIENILDFKF